MTNENEIPELEIQTDERNILAPNSLSENFVEAAGKQIELRARLLQTALKALKPHDIQDFDGKPYLEGEGAARIMAVVRGFKVGEAKFHIDQIHPHFFIECNIPMEFMGATTVAIGDCSTADPFFTGRDGQSGQYKKHLDRTGSEAMAGRLIVGDAKKKARENAISRGVTELLGLKGLSWPDLEKLGFSRTEAGSSVSFKKGSQGGEVKTISVSDALQTAKGSIVNIKGFLTETKVKTGKAKNGKDYSITGYQLSDKANSIWVQKFGEPIPLKAGGEVYAEKVMVSEYQGTKQFMAENLSNLENIGGEPSGNIDSGSEHNIGD